MHVFGGPEPEAAAEYFYAPKKRLVIRARDGYPLDATVVPAMGGVSTEGIVRPGIYISTYSGPTRPRCAIASPSAAVSNTWHSRG